MPTMAVPINTSALAERDLDELESYYLREAGLSLATRFIAQTERAFAQLAEMPRMGALLGLNRPVIADTRRWHIHGFPRLVILYRVLASGIEIIRVIDAGRDIQALFGDAEPSAT